MRQSSTTRNFALVGTAIQVSGAWVGTCTPNAYYNITVKPYKLYKPRFNQRQGTPDSALTPNPVRHYPACDCFARDYQSGKWQEVALHSEIQNTHSDAWEALEEYIQTAEADGSDKLNPIAGIGHEKWEQIVTLPSSIGRLQSVKVLSLYGSHLVRIPPEIGEMTNLEEFDPYTSYRLHASGHGLWPNYHGLTCRQPRWYYILEYVMEGVWNPRSPSRAKPQSQNLSVNILACSRVIGLSSLCIPTEV
jgi:hypothetical protein